MKVPAAMIALLLPFCAADAVAQGAGPGGPVAFAPVTALPDPLQSISGRFNSLNPQGRHACPVDQVTGRVVSARLIMVEALPCGQKETGNLLVNVLLRNPEDAAHMVAGRQVTVKGKFESAEERRSGPFTAFFLIAENAELAGGDSAGGPAPAEPVFTSSMLCQPPELDALAAKLGSDLCVQSTLVADLAATGPALETAARAAANGSRPASGDANAITCRPDRERSALHLKAIACARNSYWAWYNDTGRDLALLKPAPP